MNKIGKKSSSYYWPPFFLILRQNLALYRDFIIWIKICQFKLHQSATKCFLVQCSGVTRSMNVYGKQDKSNVWPTFMLIGWQCLVLFGYLIVLKRFFFWKSCILPLNAIWGTCPGNTRAMNFYGKQNTFFYWPPFMLKLRQNWGF